MKDGSEVVSAGSDSEGEEIKVEWEGGKYQDEIAEAQGIRIRRRPSTGPPQHAVGPFEFRLQNAGNTPRNILEEIIWNTDVEVAQVCSTLMLCSRVRIRREEERTEEKGLKFLFKLCSRVFSGEKSKDCENFLKIFSLKVSS